MHWIVFIALWGGLNFAILEIAKMTYMDYNTIKFIAWASGIIFVIWGIRIELRKEKYKSIQQRESIIQENQKKQTLLEEYGLPIDCTPYKYLSGYNNIMGKNQMYVWVEDDDLNLLTSEGRSKYQIPLEDINFYAIKGDVKQETETKGGDATLGETIIAEGLFGTAAAMKRNQVSQEVKIIDERKTIINIDIDGKVNFIFFEGAGLYNYLLENLPEKEQSFVAMNKK